MLSIMLLYYFVLTTRFSFTGMYVGALAMALVCGEPKPFLPLTCTRDAQVCSDIIKYLCVSLVWSLLF